MKKTHALYQATLTLLKNKETYPVQEFYCLNENSLFKEPQFGVAENATQHVWATSKSMRLMPSAGSTKRTLLITRNNIGTLAPLKRQLSKLAEKYKADYLLQSLYLYLE